MPDHHLSLDIELKAFCKHCKLEKVVTTLRELLIAFSTLTLGIAGSHSSKAVALRSKLCLNDLPSQQLQQFILLYKYILWMVLHHPGMMIPRKNSNEQGFPMVSKWCRILSIHSMHKMLTQKGNKLGIRLRNLPHDDSTD